MKEFFEKWGRFFGVILSPGSIFPLIIVVISLFFSFSTNNVQLSNLLRIIASVAAAISGYFIKDDLEKMKGNSLLEKKGRSAIRNLDSIARQVIQIRKWIKTFIANKDMTKKELEEIDRHLSTASVNIASGLEDWTDIVPELKEREEEVKKYQNMEKLFAEELLKIKGQLLDVGEDKKQREQLEKKMKDLEKDMKNFKKYQPSFISADMGSSDLSLGNHSGTVFRTLNNEYASTLSFKKCKKCGKIYNEDQSGLSLSVTSKENICPDCK